MQSMSRLRKNNMDRFSLSNQYRKYYRSLEPLLAKPKTRVYSTIIFFFLVVSLFGWYAIRPTIQTILYLRREIVDKTSVNQKMDGKITALITAQSLLESVQTRLALLTDAAPVDPNAVDITRQLQKLTALTSASLSAIQVSTVPIVQTATGSSTIKKNSVTYASFPITMSISGPYAYLSAFLSELLTMRRIITIQSISFSPNTESGVTFNTPTLQLVLQLTAYHESP